MPSSYDSHECPPERIRTVNAVKLHLCSLAFNRGKVDPHQCQTCKLVCKYGYRLLDLLEMEYIHQDSSNELRVKDLSTQGQALPTLRQRIKKRSI